MKIRNGFVSNSSSSSFICVGNIQKYDENTDLSEAVLIGDDSGLGKDEYVISDIYFSFEEGDSTRKIEITQDMVGKKIIVGTRGC